MSSLVETYGVEPDPAKRLRQKWGKRMRVTRARRGWTLEQLAELMTEAGYQVTPQAISQWETGRTSPRYHLRIGWCKVTDRHHDEVFDMTDEAA